MFRMLGKNQNEMIVSWQASDRSQNIKIPIKHCKYNTYPDIRTSTQECHFPAVRPMDDAVGGKRSFVPRYYY